MANISLKIVDNDGNEISQIDKLRVLKYIEENLAIDGPGGRARQESENRDNR